MRTRDKGKKKIKIFVLRNLSGQIIVLLFVVSKLFFLFFLLLEK